MFIYRHGNPLAHASFTREQFNTFRVNLIHAAGLSEWVNGKQILWHKLPPPASLEVLVERGLIGVYWLVNHSDRRGVLSPGQILDIKNLEYYPSIASTIPPELRTLLFDTAGGDVLVFSEQLNLDDALTKLGLGRPVEGEHTAPAGKTPGRKRQRAVLPNKS